MTRWTLLRRLLWAAALLALASPRSAAAQAQPEKVETPRASGTFAVLLTDANGVEGDVFNSGNPPVLDINFVLAMSPTGTYPLSITLIQEAGSRKLETPVWSGTLDEGFYRLRYPVRELPAGGGEVRIKVVMRVRMFAKKYESSSSYQYYNWEGTYKVGKR